MRRGAVQNDRVLPPSNEKALSHSGTGRWFGTYPYYYYSRRLVAVDRDSLLTTQGDIGTVATVRTSDGKLVTGTWRQVFHLNCAVRGHERTIVVTVIGCQRRSIRN